MSDDLKIDKVPAGCQLLVQLKTPPKEEDARRVMDEAPRYKAIVEYVAAWIEARSEMGDMDGKQIMDEFVENVTRTLKKDVDAANPN